MLKTSIVYLSNLLWKTYIGVAATRSRYFP